MMKVVWFWFGGNSLFKYIYVCIFDLRKTIVDNYEKIWKTLQIQVSMNDLIIYEWISPILFPVRSVSMLEIHGDTELSNMESFNLKETKMEIIEIE